MKDFTNEKSVTRIFLFNELIFSWAPEFRFVTKRLLMLGYLLCTHRNSSQARDSLWGLLNPDMEKTIPREVATEFFPLLARMATELPLAYFEKQEVNKGNEMVQEYLE